MDKIILVVPTIRENCITRFLDAWRDGLPQTIVVEDNPEKTFRLSGVTQYAWNDIDRDLQEYAWIIPRRSDCIRSYGFLKAAQAGADIIVTLDDDCFPTDDTPPDKFFALHADRLLSSGHDPAWQSTVDGIDVRGIPYFQRDREHPVMVNLGLWKGVLDLDAPTQLTDQRTPQFTSLREGTAPIGTYFPVCGMNLAFRVKMLPAMYFLLMGQAYPFDRFGDIWCGLFVKRILDHLRFSMTYGRPFVQHARASNVWKNLEKETPGLPINDTLWKTLDDVVLTGNTVAGCYHHLSLALPEGEYWDRLREAMWVWTLLVR